MYLQQSPSPGNFLQQYQGLLFPLIIFAIVYFLILRPQQKQRKLLQDLVNNLKPGDKIVTNSGLYGTVAQLKGDRIQVRIADNVKVEMSRNAVSALQEPEAE